MFINTRNLRCITVELVTLVCFLSTPVFGVEVTSPISLNLGELNKVYEQKGKAYTYSYIKKTGREKFAHSDYFNDEFFAHIRSGEEGWFQLLSKLLGNNLEESIQPSQAQIHVAKALTVNPNLVFKYWANAPKGIEIEVDCTAWVSKEDETWFIDFLKHDVLMAYRDAANAPDYISMPIIRKMLLERRNKVMEVQSSEFESIKQECLSQINTHLSYYVYEEKLGFSFNKLGLYERKGNFWYNEVPKEQKEWRAIFNEEKDRTYVSVQDRYASIIGQFVDRTKRWVYLIDRVEAVDADWLLLLKETFEGSIMNEEHLMDRDFALGKALANDPQTVFSILKVELSNANYLKNVCGNTYEDLLWGVAVEEQVIGAALEKLEARKKSLISMKDKSLSDMKNQCIQAVDNSLAVWKGREK